MASHNYIEDFIRDKIIEDSIDLNHDKDFYKDFFGSPVLLSEAQKLDNQTTMDYHTRHIELVSLIKLYERLCPYEFKEDFSLQTLKRELGNSVTETNNFLIERLGEISEYNKNLEEMGSSDFD